MKNVTKVGMITILFAILIVILSITEVIGYLGGLGLLILCVIVGSVFFAIYNDKDHKAIRKEKENKLLLEIDQLTEFKPSNKMVNMFGYIAIDEDRKQIVMKDLKEEIVKFSYADILSCEVIEDGTTTYKKSSIISRSLVGGVIAGGTGAIIGGLSGKEKENREVGYLDLRIVVKNTHNPYHKLRFFDAWEETAHTKRSINISDTYYKSMYQKSLDLLKEWKDILDIIIDRMDRELDLIPAPSTSISDELTKLYQLMEKGIISEEEYNKQKDKLMA